MTTLANIANLIAFNTIRLTTLQAGGTRSGVGADARIAADPVLAAKLVDAQTALVDASNALNEIVNGLSLSTALVVDGATIEGVAIVGTPSAKIKLTVDASQLLGIEFL